MPAHIREASCDGGPFCIDLQYAEVLAKPHPKSDGPDASKVYGGRERKRKERKIKGESDPLTSTKKLPRSKGDFFFAREEKNKSRFYLLSGSLWL